MVGVVVVGEGEEGEVKGAEGGEEKKRWSVFFFCFFVSFSRSLLFSPLLERA